MISSVRITALSLIAMSTVCTNAVDRRFSSATFTETEAFRAYAALHREGRNTVNIWVYSYPTPEDTAPKANVLSLADRGQAAFITEAAKLPAKAPSLASRLGQPFIPPDEPKLGGSGLKGGAVDSFKFDRTLVLSVNKGIRSRPGDRLEWILVEVQPKGDFKFTGYTVLGTETKTVNIADIVEKNSVSGSAKISAAKLAEVADAEASVMAERSRQSTATISQRYENLGIDIEPDRMLFLRESERGLDATGNSIVKLSLEVVPGGPTMSVARSMLRAESPKLYENGRPLSPRQAELGLRLVRVPPACPLRADVRVVSLRRNVDNGRSYVEGDQAVDFIYDVSNPMPQTIIPGNEIAGPAFGVRVGSLGQYVEARTPDNTWTTVVFDTLENARAFAEWLRRTRARAIGSSGIQFSAGKIDIPASSDFIGERIDPVPSAAACETLEEGARAEKGHTNGASR